MKSGLPIFLSLMLCCAGTTAQVPMRAVAVQTLAYGGSLSGPLAFSPDGRWLACGCGEQDMVLWDLERRRVVHRLHPKAISAYSVAFSPDSKLVATGGHDEDVRLWEVKSGKLLRTLKGVEGGNRIYKLEFTPDGRTIAAACYHSILETWDVGTGRRTQAMTIGWRAWDLSVSPDGRTVAITISNPSPDEIDIYDVRTGRHRSSLADDGGILVEVAYSPDGKLIAGASETALRLWEARTGRRRWTVKPPGKSEDYWVTWLSFLPGGKTLVSGGSNGIVCFWSVKSGRLIRIIKAGNEPGTDKKYSYCAVSKNGRTLACTSDGVVRLYDLQRILRGQVLAANRRATFTARR